MTLVPADRPATPDRTSFAMCHTDLIGSVYPNGAFKSLALARIAALQGEANPTATS